VAVEKELGMADDRIGTPESEVRNIWSWTELFRTFQVALDPKKLLLAAAGILVMWAGWSLLAVIFFSSRSEPKESDYDPASYARKYGEGPEANRRAKLDYQADLAQYRLLEGLAGPGGLLRVEPWHEPRGPNPFLMVTGQLQGGRPWEAGQFWDWFLTKQAPVLIEPLVKILRPIVLLLRPEAEGWNRVYLLLVSLWTLATWALFGGAITRLAAVQLAGKDRPGLVEAVRFVLARYVSYFSAPVVPLVFVALIVVLSILFGFLHLIPIVGDLLDGVAWPVLLLLGFGQAVLLIGLVGYPLMYATISAEGSDAFDALSRSYNYVFQAPWNYIWYCLVAIAYGAALVFFVCFLGSLVVYLTKWSVSQTPGTDYWISRKVDNLFVYAPTSFQWRDLLVDVPELESQDPAVREQYMQTNFYFSNYVSAFLVSLWVTLIFLLVIGFGYSYFFSAGTMIYLLMRRKVDETELDEVYLEEEEPDEPLLPPSAPAGTPAPAGAGTPLQMVEAPAVRTPESAPAPAPVTAPPAPAAAEPGDDSSPAPAPPDRPADGNGSPG
jgi:hypothetical protein